MSHLAATRREFVLGGLHLRGDGSRAADLALLAPGASLVEIELQGTLRRLQHRRLPAYLAGRHGDR
jgi:hypothetical protein